MQNQQHMAMGGPPGMQMPPHMMDHEMIGAIKIKDGLFIGDELASTVSFESRESYLSARKTKRYSSATALYIACSIEFEYEFALEDLYREDHLACWLNDASQYLMSNGQLHTQ